MNPTVGLSTIGSKSSTTFRYTLTPPAINSAKEIWFLVSGQAKQEALANVLSERKDPAEYPSQLIHPTRWFVTRDAMFSRSER